MKEKWPEEGASVLFYCDERERFYGRFHVGMFSSFVYAPGEAPVPEFSMPGYGGITATHWMYLPPDPFGLKGTIQRYSIKKLRRERSTGLWMLVIGFMFGFLVGAYYAGIIG